MVVAYVVRRFNDRKRFYGRICRLGPIDLWRIVVLWLDVFVGRLLQRLPCLVGHTSDQESPAICPPGDFDSRINDLVGIRDRIEPIRHASLNR